MKTIQYFNAEQVKKSQAMTVEQRLRYLDNFAKLQAAKKRSEMVSDKTKLISLKVPESLLDSFKTHCELNGVKYQTQIKVLMQEYLSNE